MLYKSQTGYQLLFIFLFIFPVSSFSQSIKIADSLHSIGEYREAIQQYDRFIQAKKNIHSLEVGNAQLRRAIDLTYIGQYNDAVKGYLIALEIFEKILNKERIATTYSNLAYLYSIQQNTELNGRYLKKSFDIFRELKDSSRMAELMNDLALWSHETNNIAGAISLHHNALRDYKTFMPPSLISKHLFNLGSCFEETNADSALYYYKKATKLAVENADSSLLPAAYANMGDLYKQKGRLKEALHYLTLGIDLHQEYGDSTDLSIMFHNLSEVYDSLKDYKKAYEFATRENQINNWLYNIEKNKFATELSEKYESGKKDEKIQSQEVEGKRKSRILLVSLVGLLIVAILAIVAYYQYRQKKNANLVLQDKNRRIEKLNNELDASNRVKGKLFSVISHDIRGPVSSLYAYLNMHLNTDNSIPTKQLSDHIIRQTSQLLDTLEELLAWSKTQMHQFVLQNEKVDVLKLITDMAELYSAEISSKNLQFVFNTPAQSIIQTDVNILAVIIRNIINNAVKHSPPNATIQIQTNSNNTGTEISFSNPMQSLQIEHTIPYNAHKDHSGIGNVLIRDFANLLNIQVDITTEGYMHVCRLFMPL